MHNQKNFLILARALLATKPSLVTLVEKTDDVALGRIITSCLLESYGGMVEWRLLAEDIENEAKTQGRLRNWPDEDLSSRYAM
jgi:hypothetical protein